MGLLIETLSSRFELEEESTSVNLVIRRPLVFQLSAVHHLGKFEGDIQFDLGCEFTIETHRAAV